MITRSLLCLGGLLSATALAAPAAPRPVVVELYTSQGCSSCPPAEALLGELTRDPNVLALAFHVDYWDGLGWPDRFASAAATARQQGYARALHLASPYTPQVVIDGQTDRVGSDRSGIRRALASGRSGVPVGLTQRGDTLAIDLPDAGAGASADVTLYAYLEQARSAIGRGENAGRTLQEFHIVRSSSLLGHWQGEAQRFTVPAARLPPDATGVAVLVQQPGPGPVLGAASLVLQR